MIKPDIATELERVNEKLADYMTEDHNILIDKLDLLIKITKKNNNQQAKIAESLRLIKEFKLRQFWEVQDQSDLITKLKKILES